MNNRGRKRLGKSKQKISPTQTTILFHLSSQKKRLEISVDPQGMSIKKEIHQNLKKDTLFDLFNSSTKDVESESNFSSKAKLELQSNQSIGIQLSNEIQSKTKFGSKASDNSIQRDSECFLISNQNEKELIEQKKCDISTLVNWDTLKKCKQNSIYLITENTQAVFKLYHERDIGIGLKWQAPLTKRVGLNN